MSDTPSGAPDGATATPTPAVGTATSTAPVTPDVPAQPSKGDWAGMAKTIREQGALLATTTASLAALQDTLAKLVPQPKPEAPAKPASADATAEKLADLEFRLSLKDALSAAGVTDRTFAELVEKAARAERPADLAGFVGKFAALAPKPVTQAAPAPVATAPSNTGPPSPGPATGGLDPDPWKWSAEVVDRMGVEAWRKACDEYAVKNGKGNPFRAARRRAAETR